MGPVHIQLANSTLRRVIKLPHFPLEIMLVCVCWYAAYPLSLRNLKKIMAERGVMFDDATVHRCAEDVAGAGQGTAPAQATGQPQQGEDETYLLVGGQWKYLLLTAHRDATAVRRFFERNRPAWRSCEHHDQQGWGQPWRPCEV